MESKQFAHIRKASIPSTITAGPTVSPIPRIYPQTNPSIHPSFIHPRPPLNPGPRPVSCHRGARALSPLSHTRRTGAHRSTSSNSFQFAPTVVRGARHFCGSCLGMPRCNTATNPPETTMSELICSGCLTLLLYTRGAANIRCSRCNRVNSTRSASQIAHLTCGQCRTTLMYPPGASTVRCATCQYDNPVRSNGARGSPAGQGSSARPAPPDARPQTVLVENPKTLNEKGKLVSNVAVGVTSWKR